MLKKSVVSCRSGWACLYEPIIDKIMVHDSNVDDVEKKIGIFQVKEKFGQLTINLINPQNASHEIMSMIYDAARRSTKICEFCGTTSNVGTTKNNWYKTCCESCWEKYIKVNNPDSRWERLV